MPRKKATQRLFGLYRPILYHPETGKFAIKVKGKILGKDEYLVLINAAIKPDFFTNNYWKEDVKSFGRIYARCPDDVLAYLCLVRKILAKWQRTVVGKVIIFCYTHSTVPITERKIKSDSSGKPTIIVETDKIWGTEKEIPKSSLPLDKKEEMEKMTRPELVPVSSLSDKDLAKLLKVEVESVKKARQEIARLDKKIAYWESPQIQHYMKTGENKTEPEHLQKGRRKGKKSP